MEADVAIQPLGAKGPPISRDYPARLVRIRRGNESLVLGPVLMTDVGTMTAAQEASRLELQRFMPWAHHRPSLEERLERLRNCEASYYAGREYNMGLFREQPSGSRELLCCIGLHPRVALNPRGLEVGYWTATPHAKRGYATFAVQCAATYAFDKLGTTRLQVMCDEANVASRRVIEKSGFELEGVFRNLAAEPAEDLLAAGFIFSGRHRVYALFPDTFAALPWVHEVRAQLSYTDVLGHE